MMKNRFQKILCMILSAVILIASAPFLPLDAEAAKNPFATDNYVERDGFRFYLWDPEADGGEDRGAVLIKYSGEKPNVNVPAAFEGRPVTEIYDSAFYGLENLLKVTLPDSVTRIDKRAFSGCTNLKKIILPNGLKTISSEAFKNCTHLWDITLPDSLETIGDSAFSGCEMLTELTLPVGIHTGGFLRFSCVRTIRLKEGVEEIPDNAFAGCTLNTVYLPDSLKRIGSSAFDGVGLHRVDFGSGLETILTAAFANNPDLYQVNFPASLKTIGRQAFSCTYLREVTLPDGLESIDSNAFESCSLKIFQIPDSVTHLGNGILKNNSEIIDRVVLPNMLQTAGACVFNQSHVKNVVVPDTGETPIFLSERMFEQSDNMFDLWLEGKTDPNMLQAAIGSFGVSRLHFRQAPNAELHEAISAVGYKYLDNNGGWYNYLVGKKVSKPLQSGSWFFRVLNNTSEAELILFSGEPDEAGVITIPETLEAKGKTYSVVSIGAECFSHLGNIRKVVAPASVRIIGDNAFEECAALEEVCFPCDNLSIGHSAFKNCLNMTAFTGASPVGIGVEAFYGDVKLQTLPAFENTLYIYDSAFEKVGQECSSPMYIDFGDRLQYITYSAFADANITFTNLPESLNDLEAYAFCGTKVESVILPGNTEIVPCAAFMNCKSLTRVECSNVRIIECLAFSGCESLLEVIAGTELKRIEPYAFRDCPALSFTPQPETAVCDYAFCTDSGDVLTLYGTDGVADYSGYECIIDHVDKLVIADGVETVKRLEIVHVNELIIPASLSDLDTSRFSECRIETVICNSETLQSLKYVDLDTIVFGENVTSVPACAKNNTLKKAVFLGEVKTIQARAFYGCSGLETVEFTAPIESVGEAAFYSCSNLDYETLPLIESIGSRAFKGCRIRRLELPEGTVSVGKNAFEDCGMEELVLPVSLQKLDDTAFCNNDDLCSIVYNCENLQVTYSALSYNSDFHCSPFYACSVAAQEFTLGPTVKNLPPYLFCMTKPDTVVIPAGVSDIPKGLFAYSSVRDVQCLGTIESIGEDAFSHCAKLNSAPLNDGLMLIGSRAFYECPLLSEIIIPGTTVNIAERVFMHCDRLVSVTVPDGIVFLANGLFMNCPYLAEVEWNCTHKYIGSETFKNCFSLSDFSFENISKLYEDSFKGSGLTCASLGEAQNEVAAELEIVEVQSFMNCPDLQTVALGGNVNTVQSRAFADCENLETAVIADSVETIAHDAFENCPKLTIYCSEDSYAYNYAKSNGIPVSTFVIEPIPNQKYTGKVIEPAVNVSVSGKPLSKGVDFKVKYSDNINVGTANVKVSGINDYNMFSSIVSFAILTRNISESSIENIANQGYTGSEITPALRITYNGKTLREGADYNVIYTNNVNPGKAKATVTGIGNFSGTVSVEFSIVETQSPSGNEGFAQRVLTFIKNVIAFIARIIPFIASLFNN